jgi:NADPH2:quinone reductase
MLAHKIVAHSGPEGVQLLDVPEPAANAHVLVDVAAAGVSFADLLQTQGEYQMKPPLPYTPGMDASGVVRYAPSGSGVGRGQRVAVLLSHGCWQDLISAPATRVLGLPDDMTLQAGAALPLNYLTALFALAWRARAQTGETLLVHGAAGGVGTAAIQIGQALGLRTIAVVSDETKREFALECGAHHAVLSVDWLAAVRDQAGDRAVDIVIDPIGGDRMTDSLRSLAPDGRLLVVGFAGGEIPAVKVNRLLLTNTGVLGAASLEYFDRHPAAISELWAQILRLWHAGVLPAPPMQLYPFDDARSALRAIQQRTIKGKAILSKYDPLLTVEPLRRSSTP